MDKRGVEKSDAKELLTVFFKQINPQPALGSDYNTNHSPVPYFMAEHKVF